MTDNENDPKEEHANWKSPEAVDDSTKEAEVKEQVAERFAQTFSSRLSEYLTGMKPENPAMLERLSVDQEIVRAKYGLPSWDLSPAEFERALMQIVKSLGVKIKPKSECGKFFEENPFARAVHFGSGKIGIDMDRTEREAYLKNLDALEHELIHAIQDLKSPAMPIELMEYEAYVAGANIEYFKKNPEDINDIFFNFFMGVSININYKLESKRIGEKVSPIWDNPEYFLKRDGIDPKKIKTVNRRKPIK